MSDKELEPPSRPEGSAVEASAGGWGGLRNPRWIGLLCEAAAETILGNLHAKHAPPSFINYCTFYYIKRTKKMKDTIKDGIEDRNRNGRIDGDNGDGIYSNNEIWTETDPNSNDTDSDGFNDSAEIQWGYNPLSKDSDRDGIPDNEEDLNGNGIRDGSETSAILFDTDGDGLSDKKEIIGWRVLIIYEATFEQYSYYYVNSNPLIYDTDYDGLNDYQEFCNLTDPNKNDTDEDGITDSQELMGGFNSSATGIDGTPPEIWQFNPFYEVQYCNLGMLKIPDGGFKIIFEVGVKDLFGIRFINVDITSLEDQTIYCNDLTNVSYSFEWSINSWEKFKSAILEGFNINLTAMDRNDNIGYNHKELPSIADIIINNFIGPLKLLNKVILRIIDGLKVIINYIEGVVTSSFIEIKECITTHIPELCNLFMIISISEELSDNVQEKLNSILLNIFSPAKILIPIFININKYISQFSSIVSDLYYIIMELLFKTLIDLFNIETNVSFTNYLDFMEDYSNYFTIDNLTDKLFGVDIYESTKGINIEDIIDIYGIIYLLYKALQNCLGFVFSLLGMATQLGGEAVITGGGATLGTQICSIISFILTCIGAGIWLYGFLIEDDDWNLKLKQKTWAGIVYIASATCMAISIFFGVDKVLSPFAAIAWCVGAIPWLIDAIIFIVRYETHFVEERKRNYNRIRSTSISFENDYDYNYEVCIDLVQYKHKTSLLKNNEFDKASWIDGNLIRPDPAIYMSVYTWLPIITNQFMNPNIKYDYIHTWSLRDWDENSKQPPKLYTCLDTIELRIWIVDKDCFNLVDEDENDDFIDISPSSGTPIGFIIFDIINNKVYLDYNENGEIDEGELLNPKNCIIYDEGGAYFSGYGIYTIKGENNSPYKGIGELSFVIHATELKE
ncbi:MAG: hypothetical protein QCI82_00855 [Candidatus Thermoplasmatota archaeon]|nr:hypothetical protein [Candidatus Thermoplasmatota archaeon]